MRGLEGKVVYITGAASGIGRGIALRFAQAGCNCAVLDLDTAGSEVLVAQLRALGVNAAAATVDITDYAAVAQALVAFGDSVGAPDILVNNAGWDRPIPFLETDPEFWRKVVDINLYGPLNLHHLVAPTMVERGGGRIINIASDAGRVGSSGEAVYSACKGGIIAFTKTLCRELARNGVRINCVCPGPSDTPLLQSFADDSAGGAKLHAALARAIPLKRLGTPEDIAGLVAFLASDEAEFIVGQTISVSGGLTMA